MAVEVGKDDVIPALEEPVEFARRLALQKGDVSGRRFRIVEDPAALNPQRLHPELVVPLADFLL